MEPQTGSKLGKEYVRAVYCHLAYLTLCRVHHEIHWAGRSTSYNLRYADNTMLMVESQEELKNLLMRMKEDSGKAGLKLKIQKTKIMTLGPIT